MKTKVIQTDTPGEGAAGVAAAPTGSAPRRTGRILAGATLAAFGAGALVGGGALVAVHATQRGAGGFYEGQARALATPTRALVSPGVDVDGAGPGWLLSEGRLGDVRVAASGARDGPVFVGVARRADVDRYLAGVAHEVADFEGSAPAPSIRSPGTRRPAPPASQSFWARTASGTGAQSVVWPIETGDWEVVVMNPDGAARVTATTRIGVRTGIVLWLGAGMLVLGAALTGAGVALIASGRRPGRPRPET